MSVLEHPVYRNIVRRGLSDSINGFRSRDTSLTRTLSKVREISWSTKEDQFRLFIHSPPLELLHSSLLKKNNREL